MLKKPELWALWRVFYLDMRHWLSWFFFALLFYGVLRLGFYAYNRPVFQSLTWSEFGAVPFWALRFDASALAYLFLPFLALWLLPFFQFLRSRVWGRGLLLLSLALPVCLALTLELADIFYFPYGLRRLLWGDLQMQWDILRLVPTFLAEFWWAALLLFLLYVLIFWAARFWLLRSSFRSWSWYGAVLCLPLWLGPWILLMRGGWQLRPLVPASAALYLSKSEHLPLLGNAVLSVLHASQQQQLSLPSYFETEADLDQAYAWAVYRPKGVFKPRNVVLIILESMGHEYLGTYHPAWGKHTPFLDSLLQSAEGLRFDGALASGTRSVQGIAAILGAMPVLMESPYIFSPYQTNKLVGLPTYLRELGYHTAFFHPGFRATMDFNRFMASLGVHRHYGFEDYPNGAEAYDGQWGAWDDLFYAYTLEQLRTLPRPFFAAYFSINPHHPFVVPRGSEQGLLPALRYADAAFGDFWRAAQKETWFDSTLFILTADHVGPVQTDAYYNRLSRYRIPLWLYAKGDTSLRGLRRDLVSQIQIMPTVLDYLAYPKAFASMQPSVLDSAAEGLHFTYDAGLYQLADARHLILFDGREVVAFYDHEQDPSLSRDLWTGELDSTQARLLHRLKGLIQRHHGALLRNRWPSWLLEEGGD